MSHEQLATAQHALDWSLARSYVGTPFEAFKDLPAGLHIALEEGLAAPTHRPELVRSPPASLLVKLLAVSSPSIIQA